MISSLLKLLIAVKNGENPSKISECLRITLEYQIANDFDSVQSVQQNCWCFRLSNHFLIVAPNEIFWNEGNSDDMIHEPSITNECAHPTLIKINVGIKKC